MANVRIGLDEICRCFHELEDPRSTINQRHPFVSVMVISSSVLIDTELSSPLIDAVK